MSNYGDIIGQIRSVMFGRYVIVQKIIFVLDAIIHLYISETGNIDSTNYTVANMIYKGLNKQMLSPSQSIDLSKLFIIMFKWIHLNGINENIFLAHVLHYIVIDKCVSQLCIEIIKALRLYSKELMDILLFRTSIRLLSAYIVVTNEKIIKYYHV